MLAIYCLSFKKYFRFKVRIGDFDHSSSDDDRLAVTVDIKNKFIHPRYNGKAAHFDVAVLETDNIDFTESIYPVCLPQNKSANYNEYDEKAAELIGWGSKTTTGANSNTLKRVKITVFPTR